jgi:hypothetical protein
MTACRRCCAEKRISHPKRTLHDAVEAAELDEPGAMKALIELKLSPNAPVSGSARSL